MVLPRTASWVLWMRLPRNYTVKLVENGLAQQGIHIDGAPNG